MKGRAFVTGSLAVAGALLGSACTSPVAPSPADRHDLTGRVVSVAPETGRVTVAHKAIPGFMDAMTMELTAEPPASVATLTPGDRIRAVLVVQDDRTWIEQIERLEGASAGFDVDDARDPDIGAQVIPFELTDQSGRRFGWERFRGRTVLVSFVYTRCPLPDFCTRMTSNFEGIAHSLDESRDERIALLSISIDPEYDTPAVLREYAKTHAPSSGTFERWTFATGSADEVRAVARFFGLSYEMQSGQIVHSLRTIAVSPEGKVAAILRGNTWTPEDALAELKGATD